MQQNAVKIVDKEREFYLVSRHRHDFVEYRFSNGGFYAIDGGNDYVRVIQSVSAEQLKCVENFCLSDDSSFDEITNRLLWGTYGKDGDQPLFYKPLISLEISHLQAILKTQRQLRGTIYEKVINFILKNKK